MLPKTLRFFFSEFFFLGRAPLARIPLTARGYLSQVLPAFFVLQELAILQQPFFYITSSVNYAVSKKTHIYRNAQGYADKKGLLWGLTNQQILTTRNISKGRESDLTGVSGVVLNFSPLLLQPAPWRFLRDLERIIVSVGDGNGDFPLFITPRTRGHEGLLAALCRRYVSRFTDRTSLAYATLLFRRLLQHKQRASYAQERAPLVRRVRQQHLRRFRTRYTLWSALLTRRQRRGFRQLRSSSNSKWARNKKRHN